MRVGIVNLQRNPPDPHNWIRHHKAVGISHFYIRVEDSPGLIDTFKQLASAFGVHIHAETAPTFDRSKEDNYTDLMTRQRDFVNASLVRARTDGVDWLFHIDDDEALLPRSHGTWADVLRQVAPSCASIHVTNWEGFSPDTPAGPWLTDPGMRYLDGRCAHLYAAYANGKSASRTVYGQSAHGPHHFTGGKECELDTADGVVLHHDSLAMHARDTPAAAWLEKNKLRLTSDLSKIPFEATKASVEALRSGDAQAQRDTWIKYRSQAGERFQACQFPVSVTMPLYPK